MEAMVAELPVIATNVGDNQYLVKESFNGFVVPCGDVKLIACKLEYLGISEKIRNEFGKNSYRLIRDEFSEEKFLENYFKLFSRMESTFKSGITPSN
jgi:glycosyltransferase involved in cell wall biosynthesis